MCKYYIFGAFAFENAGSSFANDYPFHFMAILWMTFVGKRMHGCKISDLTTKVQVKQQQLCKCKTQLMPYNDGQDPKWRWLLQKERTPVRREVSNFQYKII